MLGNCWIKLSKLVCCTDIFFRILTVLLAGGFSVIILFRAFVSFSRDSSFVSEQLEVLANCDNEPWNGFIRYKECTLITQNFLPWAGTAPPIFVFNIQILGGPNWIWKGETPSLAPSGVAEGREMQGFVQGSSGAALPWASTALPRVWGFGFMISFLWKIAPLFCILDVVF